MLLLITVTSKRMRTPGSVNFPSLSLLLSLLQLGKWRRPSPLGEPEVADA